MNTEKFKTLEANVIAWATERNIFEKSNPRKQILKTYEEIGELLAAIEDNDLEEIKDAIGDIFVTIIIFAKMKRVKISEDLTSVVTPRIAFDQKILLSSYAELYSLRDKHWHHHATEITYFLKALGRIALHYQLDLLDCLESAYNVIKNRKGKMINGTFVKE